LGFVLLTAAIAKSAQNDRRPVTAGGEPNSPRAPVSLLGHPGGSGEACSFSRESVLPHQTRGICQGGSRQRLADPYGRNRSTFLGIGEKDVAVPLNALKFMAERPAARTTTATTTTTTGTVANPNPPAATTAPPAANAPATTTARTDTAARADDDGVPDYIVLAMTKEQLNSAPKFEDTSR
jgi:hypothetical protein